MVEACSVNAESAADGVAPNTATLIWKSFVKIFETMCSITHIDLRLIVEVPCRDEVVLIGKDVFASLAQDVTPGAWSDTFPLLAQPIMEHVNEKMSNVSASLRCLAKETTLTFSFLLL